MKKYGKYTMKNAKEVSVQLVTQLPDRMLAGAVTRFLQDSTEY